MTSGISIIYRIGLNPKNVFYFSRDGRNIWGLIRYLIRSVSLGAKLRHPFSTADSTIALPNWYVAFPECMFQMAKVETNRLLMTYSGKISFISSSSCGGSRSQGQPRFKVEETSWKCACTRALVSWKDNMETNCCDPYVRRLWAGKQLQRKGQASWCSTLNHHMGCSCWSASCSPSCSISDPTLW